MKISQVFWYDGKLIERERLELNITDPGLLYGATVFTTLRVYQNSLEHPLTHWMAHCDRLERSLQAFEWQLPDWQRLLQGARVLLPHYPVLRLAIFADGREWIIGRFLPEDLQQRQQQGIRGWIADKPLFRRSLPNHKTGNYLGAWLALQKASELGAKEAILIDDRANWLETSTGNLWGWKDDCWWTPALESGILPGIARSHLLQALTHQGVSVRENRWTPDFVRELQAIAYSNSAIEIVPFASLLDQQEIISFNPYHSAIAQLRVCFQI